MAPMTTVARCLCLLALVAPLLWGCQKPQDSNSSDSVSPDGQQQSVDPTRARWQKDKAEIFAAVETCDLKPADAIRQLEQRRSELSPALKDGRALGFSPERVEQIARQAGCPGA